MGSDLFKFKFKSGKTDTEPGKSNINFSERQLGMSDDTFKSLRDVIYQKCGIYYTESKKYLLEGRINKRVAANNMNSFEEYVKLINNPSGRDEINELFQVITINETYFFRAEQQFEAFEKLIVPEIIQSKKGMSNPTFRVWSAASSTGEEAYTLAMIIRERLIPLYPNVQFQVLASDINNAVIDAAKSGFYKEYVIRNIPEKYLAKYFKKQGSTYVLDDEIKKLVRFANINLYDQKQMKSVVNCDVVFCCNVLIYFDLPSKQQVVSYIFDSLNTGGYFFIGYSESLHGISKAFKLIHLPKAMAYKKE